MIKSVSPSIIFISFISTSLTDALFNDFKCLIKKIIFLSSPCISHSTFLSSLFLTHPVKFSRFANSYNSNLNFTFCILPANINLFLTIGDCSKSGNLMCFTLLITYISRYYVYLLSVQLLVFHLSKHLLN